MLLKNKIDSMEELIKEFHKNVDKTNYFKERGLSQEIIKNYKLGFAENGLYEAIEFSEGLLSEKKEEWLKDYKYILPIINENDKCDYFLTRLHRTEDTKENQHKVHNLKGYNIQFLNERYITNNKNDEIIFIVEGYFDALSLEEIGEKAIAINSVANVKRLSDLMNENKKENMASTFIFISDNDKAGNKMDEKVKEFIAKDFYTTIVKVPQAHNDVNDFFISNKKEFEKFIGGVIQSAKNERNKSNDFTINHVENFLTKVESKAFNPKSTGFEKLDKALGGGLYPGLSVIGAEPGVGKTAIMNHMTINLIEEGTPVIFVSLEMSREEMMMRTIVNREFHKNNKVAFSEKEIKENKISRQKLTESINNNSREVFKKLKIIDGAFDYSIEKLEKEIEKFHYSNEEFVVIIDYLQILQTHKGRNKSDKERVESVVQKLKIMSKEYLVPIVCISSISRGSYNRKFTIEDFKESGNIEYSSDVCIGLSINIGSSSEKGIKQAKEEINKRDVRELRLDIVKNRNGGATNEVLFHHVKKYHYFIEK